MKTNHLMTVFIAFALTLTFSSLNYAAVSIKTEAAKEKFEDMPLLEKATLEIDTTKTDLTQVSHGLRKKVVFGLVPVRVYTLELLAAHPEHLTKTEDGILKSLKEAGPILLQVTFLRSLSGTKIAEAFKEGLAANKIKTLSPELEQLLKEISSIKEFIKNESFLIAVNWKDHQSTVYFQQPGAEIKSVSGSDEFAENFLSIWFGHPSDDRLHDLKKSLIK